jgi:hydroxyacylglutathione hydrolase
MTHDAPAPVQRPIDVRWIHGESTDPPIQVYAYDERTYILRQSKTVSFEAPFLYLLLGERRALLVDTGASSDPARSPLRSLVDDLIERSRPDAGPAYELVVAHSHGHGDHVAGDAQFADRPQTTVVPRDADAVREFFGFSTWPAETVTFDLGGRVLEVIGSPGHHGAAVTIYDPRTGFLLTGDTVLPGRLYAFDFPAYADTVRRLADFAEQRPVTHVLGGHIEMRRTPGRDYPFGTRHQPDEHPLELTVADLRAVRDAAQAADRPGVYRHDHFVLYHSPSIVRQLSLVARGMLRRLFTRRSK